MANTFKNSPSQVGTSPVDVYTVPAATTAVVIGLMIANITAAQIEVDIQAAGKYLGKGVPIPAGSSLSALDGKLVLLTTEKITVTSDTAASADVLVSYMEIT